MQNTLNFEVLMIESPNKKVHLVDKQKASISFQSPRGCALDKQTRYQTHSFYISFCSIFSNMGRKAREASFISCKHYVIDLIQ